MVSRPDLSRKYFPKLRSGGPPIRERHLGSRSALAEYLGNEPVRQSSDGPRKYSANLLRNGDGWGAYSRCRLRRPKRLRPGFALLFRSRPDRVTDSHFRPSRKIRRGKENLP